MRLRRKITLAFFLVSSLVSVLLALVLYRFIERQLAEDLRGKLKDITTIGASGIEVPAYEKLADRLADGDMDAKDVRAVEDTAEYHVISDHLRMVRRAEPDLVHYVYILAPTKDPEVARFVVDADVLEFRQLLARGQALPAGEDPDKISDFNLAYPLVDENGHHIELLEKALAECTPQFEEDFVYDDVYQVNSVSAYVPLSDDSGRALRGKDGRCLGVMGVDIKDTKMRAALDHAGGLAIRISIGMVILALLVSIAMGTVLTKSILELSTTVKRFAAKDFAARTVVRTKDEVGQLGHNFNEMAETIQVHSENLEELVRKRTSELVEEKATSERLLLNVLPAPIADRLLHGESLIVDRFDSVSVLFADIVGFTKLSQTTSPEVLVTMLNELFSMFDRLAEKHGLEKIKTIGDAYMVVAGIPQPIADHAVAIAHMGLDMQAGLAEYCDRTGTQLSIRIGIHTGSVVAGVIGKKKFIYDLWGDTVNTASRMESHGVPGKVHVTEATQAALAEQFEFEDRGEIEVKGKGAMRTYLLVGVKGRDPARQSMPGMPKSPA